MKQQDLRELGYASAAHGIKGGIVFKLHNSTGSILSVGAEIYTISADNKVKKMTIERIQFGNKVLCYLEGISSRTEAQELLPFKILYPRSMFPDLADDEFYLGDLIGLKVIDLQCNELGIVKDLYDNGVQTILKIQLIDEVIELPYVKNFFPKIDTEKAQLTMIMPEYD